MTAAHIPAPLARVSLFLLTRTQGLRDHRETGTPQGPHRPTCTHHLGAEAAMGELPYEGELPGLRVPHQVRLHPRDGCKVVFQQPADTGPSAPCHLVHCLLQARTRQATAQGPDAARGPGPHRPRVLLAQSPAPLLRGHGREGAQQPAVPAALRPLPRDRAGELGTHGKGSRSRSHCVSCFPPWIHCFSRYS